MNAPLRRALASALFLAGLISVSDSFATCTDRCSFRIYVQGVKGVPAAVTNLSANPATLAFGSVSDGQTSTQAFTLSNGGTVAASALSFSLPPTVSQTNNCGSSLAAGSSCTVSVTYAPTTTAALSGYVTVSDQDSIAQVSVSGTGAPAVPRTYATLNPSDVGTYVTLSNGNLTDVSYYGSGARGTIGKSSGKWYYEVTINAMASGYSPVIGVAGSSNPINTPWAGTTDYMWYGNGQLIYRNNVRSTYGVHMAAGDVIGVAVDLDNLQITFYRNGVSQGVAYTSSLFPAGTYYPIVADPYYNSYSTSMTLNFGQNAFAYGPPSGYNAGWYQ
jgi:hypothetical protein